MAAMGHAVAAATLAIALAGPGLASHGCTDTWAEASGALYVARGYFLSGCHAVGCTFSAWVYVESNGVPGLQRGGVDLLGDADWYQCSADPDLLVLGIVL